MQATYIVDKSYEIAPIDERLFSSFVEHLGRVIYTGLYEEGHTDSDEESMRGDVLSLVRQLGVRAVRYPGGNFVSGYTWEDGIGPKEGRKKRLDLAWNSLEPNLFGLHEFMHWTQKANTKPMMAVNLGTRGPEAARDLVEYCNHPGGTALSDARISNGDKDPFGVKLWCLGNEMDGFWQIGHKDADEYGRIACETAKVMKWVDPTIELVACGSSGPTLPTFGSWESTVLSHTYDQVDYISMHLYFAKTDDDTPDFLASNLLMDSFINSVTATCDYAKTLKKQKKSINISFDEWNVWYHTRWGTDEQILKERPWSVAPPILQDIYTAEDALVVGAALITLIKHADRVKIACLAQLVNAIAPIMTEPGGKAWRQTIFYPFLHASTYAKGKALSAVTFSPSYATKSYEKVSYLEAVPVWDEETGSLTIFAVNRNTEQPLELACDLRSFADLHLLEHLFVDCSDLNRTNTKDREYIHAQTSRQGRLEGNRLTILLGKASWNVIRLGHEV